MKYTASRQGAVTMVIALPAIGEVQLVGEPSAWVFNNLKVVGSLVGTMQHTASCLDYAACGLLKGISEVRGRSQRADSVQRLRRGEIAGRIVIDFNKDRVERATLWLESILEMFGAQTARHNAIKLK